MIGGPILSVPVSGAGLLIADGYLSPATASPIELRLFVAGRPAGSPARLAWHDAAHRVTHSFRLLATLDASAAGRAELRLSGAAPVTIGADIMLGFLPYPADRLHAAHVRADLSPVETDTPPEARNFPLPHRVVARLPPPRGDGPTIALAAGSVAYDGDGHTHFGDAFLGLWRGGEAPTANQTGYADNDLCACAELAAPFAVQGLFPQSTGPGAIELGASAEPWAAKLGPDTVRYRVDPGSLLIAIRPGPAAGGAAALDPAGAGSRPSLFPYFCVASTRGFPGCPPAGEPREIASAALRQTGPQTRPMLFLAAIRLQGDGHDGGGRFTLWLELDGRRVGSTGRTDLAPHAAVSTRTVTLAWLAPPGALAPGAHRVALRARAEGEFLHLAVTRNLPLLWFD